MLVLEVGGYIVYSHARSGNSAPTYVTAQAQKGMIDSTVTGSGNITVGSSANVVAASSGTVTDLAVKLGDHVTKGQVLFYVDNGQLDVTVDKSYASYLQSQQQLDSAYAQSTQAQSDLDNAVGQAGTPTSANIAALKAKLTAAQASVSSAQTNVSSAQQNLIQAQTNYYRFVDVYLYHIVGITGLLSVGDVSSGPLRCEFTAAISSNYIELCCISVSDFWEALSGEIFWGVS